MPTQQLRKANVLDYPKPGLCPDVWNDDGSLKPEIKSDIINKTNEYLADVSWISTIRILGSLTSWQYNSKSDLDVHVVVDWDVLTDEYPGLDKEGLEEVVDSYKDAMRDQQWKVLGTNHPLEISFETPDKVATTSDGIYNLITDEWEQEPRSVESDFDPEAIYDSILGDAEAITQELDISIGNVKRDIRNIESLQEALHTMDPEARAKFQQRVKERMDEVEEELLEIMEKAYDVSEERDESYEPDSEENLTFKYLQKFGYIWLWKNLEKIMGDVEEQPELNPTDLSDIKNVIDEGWCEMDDKRAKKTTRNVPRGTSNLTKKGQKRVISTRKKAKVTKKSAWALTKTAQEPGQPKALDLEPHHIERGEAPAEPPIKAPQAPKPEGVKPPKAKGVSPELTVMKADEPRTESPAAPKRSGKAWQYDEEVEQNILRVLPDLVPDYLELDYNLYRPQITITDMDEDEGIVFAGAVAELVNKTTGVKDGEMRLNVSATVESGMNQEPEGQEFWSGLTDVDVAIEDMKKWASQIPTKVVCAWCGKHLKGDPNVQRISHGMCPDCEAKVNKQLDEEEAKENLVGLAALSFPAKLDRDGMQDFLLAHGTDNFGKMDLNDVKNLVMSGGDWVLEDVPLSNFPAWDQFAGMKKTKSDQPIVTLGAAYDWEVIDGKHRIAVANATGEKTIKAYVFHEALGAEGAISLQPVYVANRVLEMVTLEKLKGMEMEAIQHEIYTWLTRNQLKYTKEDVRKIHDQLAKQTGIQPPPPKEPKPEDIEGVGPKEKPVLPPTPVEDITQQKQPAPTASPEPTEEREPVPGQEPVLKTPVEAPTAKPTPKVIGKMMRVRSAAPVEPPAKVYTYGLTYRPPSFATLPKGWIPESTKPHKDFAHGTVDFPRILTKDEMDAFELAPLDPQHPVNLKKAKDQRRQQLMETIDPEAGAVIAGLYPQPAVLSKDTRADGWRLTYFAEDGQPSGHEVFADIAEAIDFVAGFKDAKIVSVPKPIPPAQPPKTYGRMMVQKVGNRFVAVSKIDPDKLWNEYAKIITAHPNWKTNGHDWIVAKAAGHPDFNRLLELESSFPNDSRVLQVKRTATDPQAALLDIACGVLGCDVNPNQTPFLNEKQAMNVAVQFVATNNELAAEDVYGMMVSWLWVKPAEMHAHTDTEPAKDGGDNAAQPAARDRDKLEDPVEYGTQDVFPKAGPSEPDFSTNSSKQLVKDLIKLGGLNEDAIAEDLMRQFKLTEVQAFDVIDEVMNERN